MYLGSQHVELIRRDTFLDGQIEDVQDKSLYPNSPHCLNNIDSSSLSHKKSVSNAFSRISFVFSCVSIIVTWISPILFSPDNKYLPAIPQFYKNLLFAQT